MTKLSRVFVPSAAAAALMLSGLTLGASVATAQPWSHTETRCTNDACATFRCDGSDCHRISGWRDIESRSDAYARDDGYYFDDARYDHDRCYGDRCATFRCDASGDNCTRVSDWRHRY